MVQYYDSDFSFEGALWSNVESYYYYLLNDVHSSKARNYPPRLDTALRARAFAAGKKVSKAQSASAFSTIQFFALWGLSCALLFHLPSNSNMAPTTDETT
jgi:hypothetical protein